MKSNFLVETAKIVGAPAEGCWSQIHSFFPEDFAKKEKRGSLLSVLVLTGVSEGVEAVAAGREILGRLHEEYYGNLEGSAFVRLSAAVEKVAGENEGLELVAASVLGDVLYLATAGCGRVLLKRGEKVGWILGGEENLQTVSGFLQENDLLVLGSARFFDVVAEGVLRAAVENGSVSEAEEILAPIVLGREDMADAAAVLALIKRPEELPVKSLTEEAEREEGVSLAEQKKPAEKPGFFRKEKFFVRRGTNWHKKGIFLAVAVILLGLLAMSLFIGIKGKGLVKGEHTFVSPAGEIK